MSFAAEPFGVFVDDLIRALTGGVTREEFMFLPEKEPFRLGFGPEYLPRTASAHGLVDGSYFRFKDHVDFEVEDGTVVWKLNDAKEPAAGATWPDRGSYFYVSYERRPDPQAPTRLTDRNPGSVLRTFSETFAREFAVLSRQLELVYRSAFLDFAEGRDLDAVVELVGVKRRSRVFASGEVVFARTSPAPADIFIPEGTLVSTGQVPSVTVDTTQNRVLRAGALSVAVPVRAEVQGAGGAVRARSLAVVNRPMLGVETVTNPEPLTFGSGSETDDSLRRRAARALEESGGSTVGSIIGALTSVEGIREQDVSVLEDHLTYPGVVKVTVAAELDADHSRAAVALVEENRPAGIRILFNLPPIPPPPLPGTLGQGADGGPPVHATGSTESVWFSAGVSALVVPGSSSLSTSQKSALIEKVKAAINGFFEELGVGETIVYNRLVRAIMAVEGVFDVSLDIYPSGAISAEWQRRNLIPSLADTRPKLKPQNLDVVIGGALIAIDLKTRVKKGGSILEEFDDATFLDVVRDDISARLRADAAALPKIDQKGLSGLLTSSDLYSVEALHYTVELLEEGMQIVKDDPEITPQRHQQIWIRSVSVSLVAGGGLS